MINLSPTENAFSQLPQYQHLLKVRKTIVELIANLNFTIEIGAIKYENKEEASVLLNVYKCWLGLLDKPNDQSLKKKLTFLRIRLDKLCGTNPLKLVRC